MTGFARTEGASGAWTWAVEARSVNGRNLEVRFRGPPGFDAVERAVRDAAQARFQRGQVGVNLQAERTGGSASVRVDQAVLSRYAEAAADLAARGLAAQASADGLLALRGVVELVDAEDDAETRAAVEAAMAATALESLDALRGSRLAEGAALAPVLAAAVDRIEALVARAEAEAAAQSVAVRERFQRRMSELLGDTAELQERIVQEAAVLAVRADVREELDRLTGHVAAARDLFAAEGASGRRLDFLAQEFMREANTLCSKSATSALTAVGLDLKAAVEQLREQVQNVE